MKYTIRVDREDDGRWIGEVPEIPGDNPVARAHAALHRVVKYGNEVEPSEMPLDAPVAAPQARTLAAFGRRGFWTP